MLVAGVAGNAFVYGQGRREGTAVGWPLKGAIRINGDSVRVMLPDNMPCLVADLSRIERMPVKKLDSRLVRPMPNGVPDEQPRLELAPRRRPD